MENPVRFPVRLLLRAAAGSSPFRRPAVATRACGFVRGHSSTVAACLLPDRLHWLLADGRLLAEAVEQFKHRVDLLTASVGVEAPRWERCRWSHLSRRPEDLREVGRSFADIPVRAGLVARGAVYPYLVLADPADLRRPSSRGGLGVSRACGSRRGG